MKKILYIIYILYLQALHCYQYQYMWLRKFRCKEDGLGRLVEYLVNWSIYFLVCNPTQPQNSRFSVSVSHFLSLGSWPNLPCPLNICNILRYSDSKTRKMFNYKSPNILEFWTSNIFFILVRALFFIRLTLRQNEIVRKRISRSRKTSRLHVTVVLYAAAEF